MPCSCSPAVRILSSAPDRSCSQAELQQSGRIPSLQDARGEGFPATLASRSCGVLGLGQAEIGSSKKQVSMILGQATFASEESARQTMLTGNGYANGPIYHRDKNNIRHLANSLALVSRAATDPESRDNPVHEEERIRWEMSYSTWLLCSPQLHKPDPTSSLAVKYDGLSPLGASEITTAADDRVIEPTRSPWLRQPTV